VTSEISNHSATPAPKNSLKALSFFSGCMGLELGLEQEGIEILLACEKDRSAQSTIKFNRPDIPLIEDIRDYSAVEIREKAGLSLDEKIDLIVGSLPALLFDSDGEESGSKEEQASETFIDLVGELEPRFAIIEIVPELLSDMTFRYYDEQNESCYTLRESEMSYDTPDRSHLDYYTSEERCEYYRISNGHYMDRNLSLIIFRLEELRYNVSFRVYDAVNFGASQKRKGGIITCTRNGEKLSDLTLTHAENNLQGLSQWRTLREALKGISGYDHNDFGLSEYYQHLKPGQNWQDLPVELKCKAEVDINLTIVEHIKSYECLGVEDKNLFILSLVYPGKLAKRSIWESDKKSIWQSFETSIWKNRSLIYAQVKHLKEQGYRRLAWDEPLPRLVNYLSEEYGFIHPENHRHLNIEEYKRIHEFPDDWEIKGNLRGQYQQIVNATPCSIGRAIARMLLTHVYGEPLSDSAYTKEIKSKFNSFKTLDEWKKEISLANWYCKKEIYIQTAISSYLTIKGIENETEVTCGKYESDRLDIIIRSENTVVEVKKVIDKESLRKGVSQLNTYAKNTGMTRKILIGLPDLGEYEKSAETKELIDNYINTTLNLEIHMLDINQQDLNLDNIFRQKNLSDLSKNILKYVEVLAEVILDYFQKIGISSANTIKNTATELLIGGEKILSFS
jgi:DNA (cytosine-5)-methyltransferase 1